MQRQCDVCGAPFEAVRQTAKYCSGACRQAKHRGAPSFKGKVVALGALPAPESGNVEAAAVAALRDTEREHTPLGQAALVLARRIDMGRDMGAGLAALVKQFETTLRSATSGAYDQASPLDKARDELAARRATRGA